MRGYAKKTAVCGVLAAVSLAVLLLGAVIDVLDITSAAVAAVAVFIVVNAYGAATGIMLYLAITVLSFVLLTGKFAPLAFAVIGFYPIIKNITDSHSNSKFIKWIIKLFCFNVLFTGLLFFGKAFVFTLGDGGVIPLVEKILVYPLGNLLAVMLDMALNRILWRYGAVILKLLN